MRRLRFLTIVMVVSICVVIWGSGPSGVFAGDLEPPLDAVDPTGQPVSTMHTLDEIFNKVASIGLASVGKTGQETSYATGDDGDWEKGVAWSHPRFTDNSDGTVTDNLTGLIWLKNANCFGVRPWSDALSNCNGLASGSCGLTDDSSAGDWRLPNVKEMHSLIHYGVYNPALSDTAGTGQWSEDDAFTGVQSSYYWSSTTYAHDTASAWHVLLNLGHVDQDSKVILNYVWPVRGGN